MNVAALIAEHIDVVAVRSGRRDSAPALRAEPFGIFREHAVDLQHEIDSGCDLRVIGHLEVGFGRVAGEDQRAQLGIAAGERQRGQHPVEGGARFAVADARRDVRFDLILAGFAVKTGIDADAQRVVGIGVDVIPAPRLQSANAPSGCTSPISISAPSTRRRVSESSVSRMLVWLTLGLRL